VIRSLREEIMGERATPPTIHGSSLRATLAGDGTPGPIEERIGRRLVRLVDPESVEGEALLGSGTVDLIGPEGEHFGRIPASEAYRRLCGRLERRLEDQDESVEREALREGLSRLKARTDRPIGRS
jgi:hypothetical protein